LPVAGIATGSLKYGGLSLFNSGLAATYLGFAMNSDITFGRNNGSNASAPAGAVPDVAALVRIGNA